MTPSQKNLLLIVVNVIVWCGNLLTATGKMRLYAKSGIPVAIDFEPLRARLTVDGKLWDGSDALNGWIQSPATIKLSPGQHKLQLERPGYIPHSFKVLVAHDDKPQLKTSMEATDGAKNELNILTEGVDTEDVIVTVDSGLESGALPMHIDDLIIGTHTIEIKLTGIDSFRSKPFNCVVTISGKPLEKLNDVKVSRNGKKLKVTGCKKP